MIQKKLLSSMVFHKIRSDDGLERSESLTTSLPVVLNDSSLVKKEKMKKRKINELESATAESLQGNSETILKDKENICLKNIQTTKLSRISGQGSTSKGSDYSPFWNERVEEQSKKLWLPIETDLQDLPLNSLNGILNTTMLNSQFSKIKMFLPKQNSQRICLPLFTYSHVDSTACEGTKKKSKKTTETPEKKRKRILQADSREAKRRKKKNLPEETPEEREKRMNYSAKMATVFTERRNANALKKENGVVTRIKTYTLEPTKEQKEILLNWFGICRFTYNNALAYFEDRKKRYKKRRNKKKMKQKLKSSELKKTLRSKFIVKESKFLKKNKFIADCPKDPRECMIDELIKAIDTNLKKGKRFEMKFKKKSAPSESIEIRKSGIKAVDGGFVKIYPKFLSEEVKIKNFEPVTEIIKDCKMVFSGKKFYLVVPYEVECKKKQKETDEVKVVSIDPGGREFINFYSPNPRVCGKLGMSLDKLRKLRQRCKEIRNMIKKEKIKFRNKNGKKKLRLRRYRMNRRAFILEDKIRKALRDFHRKSAKFLCMNFDLIMIPYFKVQSMVKSRNLNPKAKDDLLMWSHYKFKQILKHKAEVLGKHVLEHDESYTSKTCGNCFKMDEKLGGKKKSTCPHCGICWDRDLKASRNMFLRMMFES
jgi:putative transposase